MKRPLRLSVQGWLVLVLSLISLLVAGGSVAAAVQLHRTDTISAELANDIQPARVAAYQLQAAIRDQETAVRGYVIAADPRFLDPYAHGQAAEQAAATELRARVWDRPDLLADLSSIETAIQNWRTSYAEPQIASVRPGSPAPAAGQTTEHGKVEFDRLRALFDTQNQHLMDARAAGLTQLADAQRWRNGVLIGLLVAFAIGAVLLGVLIRRAVTRPLDALAASCRRVTAGNYGEHIMVSGPTDIEAIAADVDEMRQRIADELDTARQARRRLLRQAQALDEQAAELRRSNAELEQFAYIASHDLQEPLRKVASFCQLLTRRYGAGETLDERGLEYLSYAIDGARRMQDLIDDLLKLSRVGRTGVQHLPVHLDATVEAALANLAIAIEETHGEVVRPELPVVPGDPTLLTMLWQNLIGNALKFHRPGVAPRVEISVEADGDRMWSFGVADNGVGVPAEHRDRVFVIFQRLHGRSEYDGTGIGLALCKKIVEHHGGTIWIDPDYSEGARVRFTLPMTELENPA